MDFMKSSHGVNIICSETARFSFVSHLSGALNRCGISVSVFADTAVKELETYSFPGDQNHVDMVWVMVLSETYGSSITWFATHLKHHKNKGYVVVPGFHGVDPSVVNPDPECIIILPRDGNITRHQPSDSELVKEIVRDVYGKLYPTERIGTYSRLLEIENLLCEQPWDIRSLGIWGMPGIGKTTLAKAAFDHIHSDYDASCFIDNFDEALCKAGPQRLLEEQILNIVKDEEDKLRDTRVLLVLDDVRNPLVAESFLERLNWFGHGSLIIITSRYKQVFVHCQVNQIYKVQGLNEQEALQLFSQTAFGKDVPEQDDLELSKKVIHYANGNPLALRIYGQELMQGEKSEMEAKFLSLKQRPPQKIQDMLKSVYSTLGDNEKHIFLSIACFFKGENVDYVAELLKGCGYFPRVGIDILVDKCMLAISENILQMNDLIQDIFRHIVITGDKIQKKKRNTLWQPSGIGYEDDELKVTKDIQGISLDTSKMMFTVDCDDVKNMNSLRFLKIYNSDSKNVHRLKFPKENFLPSTLMLLHWENYPFKSLPEDFDHRELVELNMPYSKLEKLSARTESLQKLRRVDLRHSPELIEFSIHVYAQNIEMIKLQGCTKLKSFPAMTKLQHLRVLNLSGCCNIRTVPGLSPNIEELNLEGTSIEELPKSFEASIEHTDQESVSTYTQGFGKLLCLNMKDCIRLESLPDMRKTKLESLQFLNISGCTSLKEIKGLPRSIKELYLAGTSIRELPEFPESLEVLNAHDCGHLKSVSLDFKKLPRHYTFSNCFSLSSETTAEFLEKGVTRVIRSATEENQEHINKAPAYNMCFPADKQQRYSRFFQWGEGSCITVKQKTLSGFAMSVLVAFRDDCHNAVGLGIRCICTWLTKKGHFGKIERVFKFWAPTEAPKVEKDHMFVFYDSEIHTDAGELTDSDDEITFEFQTVSGENKLLGATSCMVKGCGVKVITPPEVDKLVSGREIEPVSIIEEDTKPEEKSTYPIKGEEKSTSVTQEDTSFFPRKPEVESISAVEEKNTNVIEEDTSLFSREPEAPSVSAIEEKILPFSRESEEKSTSVTEENTHLFSREQDVQITNVVEEEALLFSREPEKKSPRVTEADTAQLFPRKSEVQDFEKINRERECIPPMASSSSSSSSSSRSKPPQDQVFINFRGEELRYNFVSNLCDALKRNGINAFTDEKDKEGLLEEIEGSKIALAIFSPRYTEAKWCLKELAKMRERREQGKLVVIPVFYKVNPSTVGEQRGEFGDKFKDLVKKNKEKKEEWTEALKYFGKLQGCVLHEKRNESDFIAEIVEHVLRALNNNPSRASSSNPPSSQGTNLSPTVEHQKNVESSCGIESRLKQLEEKISFWSQETTRIIGVVGPPGIGKSTLVEMLYEKSKNLFLSHVFIPDVHQITKEDGGFCYLLKILLEALLAVNGLNIKSVQGAHEDYKTQLFRKKAFVVLDDVSDREQIDAILGRRDWIQAGSKIVIATSDKSLIHGLVDDIYEVPPLSYEDSLQHFTHYVFGGQSYDPSFSKLSRDFVHYTKGNPLALKILGAELQGKDLSLWYSKLEALSKYPKGRERSSKKMLAQRFIEMLQSVWKESYDALNQQQKDTLLDIACFSSLDENYVASLLDSYGGNSTDARIKIAELVDKFLVTISGGKIEMNDMLLMFCDEQGQEASAPDGIGRRRLWDHDKIIDVLDNNKGASRIRSIFLDLADFNMRTLHSQAFASMINMRYLQIYNTDFPQEYARDITLNFPDGLQLPLEEVRCLHWLKFPLKELPPDFNPKNLVDLKLPYSEIERVWEGNKDAQKLKWIDFNHSRKLCTLSGLAEARNLQELNLEGCTALETLPKDMENMERLVVLNLRGCTNLKRLPEINLMSLQILILTNCSRFKVFHVISEKLEAIYLDGTAIKELLDDIGNLQSLVLLNMKGCKKLKTLPDSIGKLKALQKLILSGCSSLKCLPKINLMSLQILILTDCSVFEEFHVISENLEVLNLSGCSILEEIKGLPKSIKELYLGGTSIRELPEIPESLEVLNAHDCYHLKTVRLDFKQLPRHYTFSNCFSLSSETTAEFLEKGVTRVIMLATEENQEHINKAPAFNMCFPADKQRYSTFFHWRKGSCVTVELTPSMQKTLSGFAISVLVSFQDDSHNAVGLGIMCTCTWGNKKSHFGKIERVFKCWTQTEAPRVQKDHMFVFYDSEIHLGAAEQADTDDEIKFEFHTVSGENKLLGDTSCMVKGCGVKVITPPEVDKPVSGNTGGSEDICSIEVDTIVTDEESLPSPGAPEEHELHKPVKPKETGIRKWIACFWPKNSKSRKRTTRVLQESKGKGKIKQVDDDDQIKHVHPRHSICSCRSTSGSDHEAVFPEFDVNSPHQRSYCINCRKAKHMVPKMQIPSVQLEPVESTTVSPTESMRAEQSRCLPSWNR